MIHLIVGNTGAGKTTYARELKKKTNGIIFSIDAWNNTLFLPDKKETDGLDWFLERIERAETLMQQLILQLHESRVDAILDLGLSKINHREKFRQFAIAHDIECKLHFLDIPKEVRKERVLQRNTEKGDTFEFEVTEENFEFMETWFERPTDDELLESVWINH
ncbi:AAA family ATPase [Ulvibacter litoralis]|uniref:Predicted kinase n=1 Tax=Ulvibacter litoralis TaxID=227084 RepID=A0A1G7HJL8_9FLAO|nr:ATP-binding protein [Ulvibacter litoralis]GHC58067.1 hypothetical protein GCM10008083_23410 [Ulvibacter litoralis]SDF00588.1 Predicted kinase [Ulvibacter litoralis]